MAEYEVKIKERTDPIKFNDSSIINLQSGDKDNVSFNGDDKILNIESKNPFKIFKDNTEVLSCKGGTYSLDLNKVSSGLECKRKEKKYLQIEDNTLLDIYINGELVEEDFNPLSVNQIIKPGYSMQSNPTSIKINSSEPIKIKNPNSRNKCNFFGVVEKC